MAKKGTNNIRIVEFRYKLYPDDSEWSPWSDSQKASYFFINSGQHEFRVEGRYKKGNNKEFKFTQQATYSFTLEKTFLAKPVFKASIEKMDKKKEKVIIPLKLYSESKAILIGVTEFDDNNFSKLPYIKQDLSNLERELIKNNFKITKLDGRIDRKKILETIEDSILSSGENDRIIIYFSTHGFQHSIVSSEGYLSCSDCKKSKPDSSCISLSKLDKIIKKGIQKPIKHILLVIDSCFSGLGVISKNTDYPEIIRIATKPGLHMMTAGMAEQEAQMDHQLKMSVFTHFLTNILPNPKLKIEIQDEIISREANIVLNKVYSVNKLQPIITCKASKFDHWVSFERGSYKLSIDFPGTEINDIFFLLNKGERKIISIPKQFEGNIKVIARNDTSNPYPGEMLNLKIDVSGNGYLWIYEEFNTRFKRIYPPSGVSKLKNLINVGKSFKFPDGEGYTLRAGETEGTETLLIVVTSLQKRTVADEIANKIWRVIKFSF
jgi:hypothetical protein